LKETLPSGAEKAAAVRAMFDRIAPRYDLLNRVISLRLDQRWRTRSMRAAAVTATDTVIDLACGTGDFSELAAQRGAAVIGVDFSANMLNGARRRQIKAVFLHADAARLPLRTASATVVLSGFALRNFVSIPLVLREAARVLTPGGRLALLEVDTPRSPLLRLGHDFYFNRLVPWIGSLLSDAAAYAYLPRSVSYLPDADELRAMIEVAGFQQVVKLRLSGGVAQLITAIRVGSDAV
jgi:demethylmenaquinone methyltransferase / 2-methoxy-6-polyprenyl-1,4-benzoquinol methylase